MKPLLLAAVFFSLLSACDAVDRPHRPVPELFFGATTLEGTPVTRASLAGKPWVINLWLPD